MREVAATTDLRHSAPRTPRGDHGAHQPARPREVLQARVRAVADGLEPLLARAAEVQRARAAEAKRRGAPRWTDVFTTQFTEFTNRPR